MMKRILHFLILCILQLSAVHTIGQDQLYTQFFNAPNLINPGFVGSTLEFRAGLNTRVQWPAMDIPLINNAVTFDYNMQGANSGVGAVITNDRFGEVTSSSFNLLYSYKINISNKWVIAPGLQYGYVLRSFDIRDFLFGSEIVNNIDDEDFAQYGESQINYFDFSSGVVAFNSKYWFGFSAAHLNRPNISLLDDQDLLNTRWSFHAGGKFVVSSSVGRLKTRGELPYISPALIYSRQGNLDQLDMGLQFYMEPLVFGAWYRGLSITQEQSIQPNSSLALMLGVAFDQFELAYSYDFLLSGIGGRSGGAHECAIIYQFKAINRQKQMQRRQRRNIETVPPFLRERWWEVN